MNYYLLIIQLCSIAILNILGGNSLKYIKYNYLLTKILFGNFRIMIISIWKMITKDYPISENNTLSFGNSKLIFFFDNEPP